MNIIHVVLTGVLPIKTPVHSKQHLSSSVRLDYMDGYLDGLGRHSRVRGLLQVGGQVLIHVLKDQSEFSFSVSPGDRTHIKQPRKRGTVGGRSIQLIQWGPICSTRLLSTTDKTESLLC